MSIVSNISRHRRIIASIWVITAILGLALGLIVGNSTNRTIAADRQIAIDSRISYVQTVIDHPDQHIFAMQWSQESDQLWYTSSKLDGQIVLNQYSIGGDSANSLILPGKASYTPYTYLQQDSDGFWWVAANYTVWRVDPISGEVTVHVDLAPAHAYQSAGALDRGNPEPGTWINGIAVQGSSGGVLLTRNNVKAISKVATDGTVSVEELLDSAPKGLAVMDGVPFAYSSTAELVARRGTPDGMAPDAGAVIDSVKDCTLVLDPATSSGKLLTPTWVQGVGDDFSIQAGDLAKVSHDGGMFAVALSGAGAIIRGSCATGEYQDFGLPMSLVSGQGLARGGSMWTGGNDDGGSRVRESRAAIIALAVSSSGTVAFSDDASRIGIIR